MKSKFNIARFIWISSIFAFLVVVLVAIVDYKVNYVEIPLESDFVYFYDCDGEVCTSQVKNDSNKLYSEYDCEYQSCPVFTSIINNDFVLLKEEEGYVLFNYKSGVKVSSGYDNYYFIDNNFIVVNKKDKYGIIDHEDNIIADLDYSEIGTIEDNNLFGYKDSYIIAKKDDKYGIISYKDGKVKEEFKYNSKEEVLNKL